MQILPELTKMFILNTKEFELIGSHNRESDMHFWR